MTKASRTLVSTVIGLFYKSTNKKVNPLTQRITDLVDSSRTYATQTALETSGPYSGLCKYTYICWGYLFI